MAWMISLAVLVVFAIISITCLAIGIYRTNPSLLYAGMLCWVAVAIAAFVTIVLVIARV